MPVEAPAPAASVGIIGSDRVSNRISEDTSPLTTIGLGPSELFNNNDTRMSHKTTSGHSEYDTEEEDNSKDSGLPGTVRQQSF